MSIQLTNGLLVDPSAIENSDPNYRNQLEYFNNLHYEKYRDNGQTRHNHSDKLADRLSSDFTHKTKLYNAISCSAMLFAGRVQAAYGSDKEVSPFNCSVSQTIEDDMESILNAQKNAVKILRLGTGIGYNFSHLRPEGSIIQTLQSEASGPISFMDAFDAWCGTIRSAGHRRGAQMGILNVDHPDIEKFIDAKMKKGRLINFNISVGITDAFMKAVKEDSLWNLKFGGVSYTHIPARYLWEKITKNAYESAEPGILFLDRFNDMNNLYYCEHIEATNPCSEQPLPPYGLCTLGSLNLVAYLYKENNKFQLNYQQFIEDIYTMVEAMDNIFDNAIYAIPEHEQEAQAKRRIGIGLTGIANAIELLIGLPSYGNEEFCLRLDYICRTLAHHSYLASVELARKRGPFKLFDRDKYLASKFVQTLPEQVQQHIYKYGIRNSHLISYAPCGTISQIARNVSSGVEPIFHHAMQREVFLKVGKTKIRLDDFAVREHSFYGKTLEDCSIKDHLEVAKICQKYCDSAVSKTINVASNCTYEEYASVYMQAYEAGLKGVTVFRPTELRGSVIKKAEEVQLDLPIQMPIMLAPGMNSCANGACER